MAIIKYKDTAGEWKNLLAVEDGGGGTGGDERKPIFVTVNGDRASLNGKQIAQYANNGYAVYIKPSASDEFCVALSHYYKDGAAFFSYVNAEETISYCCMVDAEGIFEEFEDGYITSFYFHETVGDIETALDSIIAMQEALIGGGSV